MKTGVVEFILAQPVFLYYKDILDKAKMHDFADGKWCVRGIRSK